MFTFAFYNEKMRNVGHRKRTLYESCFETSQFLLRTVSFYIERDIYLRLYPSFKKFLSNCRVSIIWFVTLLC